MKTNPDVRLQLQAAANVWYVSMVPRGTGAAPSAKNEHARSPELSGIFAGRFHFYWNLEKARFVRKTFCMVLFSPLLHFWHPWGLSKVLGRAGLSYTL